MLVPSVDVAIFLHGIVHNTYAYACMHICIFIYTNHIVYNLNVDCWSVIVCLRIDKYTHRICHGWHWWQWWQNTAACNLTPTADLFPYLALLGYCQCSPGHMCACSKCSISGNTINVSKLQISETNWIKPEISEIYRFRIYTDCNTHIMII